MNSSKGTLDNQVLDPFEVANDWFEILLPSLQYIPKHDILYETDFLAWCERTVSQLKAKDVENLDFENLIEEVESLGKSERRELRNRLLVLIAQILKRMYVNSSYLQNIGSIICNLRCNHLTKTFHHINIITRITN